MSENWKISISEKEKPFNHKKHGLGSLIPTIKVWLVSRMLVIIGLMGTWQWRIRKKEYICAELNLLLNVNSISFRFSSLVFCPVNCYRPTSYRSQFLTGNRNKKNGLAKLTKTLPLKHKSKRWNNWKYLIKLFETKIAVKYLTCKLTGRHLQRWKS